MSISTNCIEEGVMVVIPVFNCKNYISDAVSSIKKQPYKKIFIILVDDGSTDGSSEICDNIAKKWDESPDGRKIRFDWIPVMRVQSAIY